MNKQMIMMTFFTRLVCIFAALVMLASSKSIPKGHDESFAGPIAPHDADHSASHREEIPHKEGEISHKHEMTSSSRADDEKHSLDVDSKKIEVESNEKNMRDTLNLLVSGVTLETSNITENTTANDILKFIALLALTIDPPLTEEQLAYLVCFILCGLDTCPPSCPAYYNPPWGPLESKPVYDAAERFFYAKHN